MFHGGGHRVGERRRREAGRVAQEQSNMCQAQDLMRVRKARAAGELEMREQSVERKKQSAGCHVQAFSGG